MTRPLRIEYPGAWHHVMNRGRRGEDIFLRPEDCRLFLQIVREACEGWNLKVSAYCLMTNHYHLLVNTPDGNLSRCMRHINGVYTQRFNRSHHFDGQLFRGRFKSVLIEEDSHLLEVMRYIHRNPLIAGLCQQLDGYPWSSHGGYLSSAKQWDWIKKEPLLEILTSKPSLRKAAYLDFVAKGVPEEIAAFYGMKTLPSLLGGEAFKDWVKTTFHHLGGQTESAERRDLSLTPEEIIIQVCNYFHVDESCLKSSRRGAGNLPRNSAIYLARYYSRFTLAEIGAAFGISKYSTVSSVIERVKTQKTKDKVLMHTIDQLMAYINKSQGQT